MGMNEEKSVANGRKKGRGFIAAILESMTKTGGCCGAGGDCCGPSQPDAGKEKDKK